MSSASDIRQMWINAADVELNVGMRRRTLTRVGTATFVAAGAVGVAVAIAPGTASACVQYVQPYNPFIQTCGIPNNPPVVRGASPGAGAIIACRDVPGCLSYVVNGGPGFPGMVP